MRSQSQLAHHFHNARSQRGLSRVELARLIGYKNATKGCNRIQQFEERGEIHTDLLRKLAVVLGIDGDTINDLIEQDRREFERECNEWADVPIRPYLIIRLIPAFYKSQRLPDDIESIHEAEIIGADAARHWRKKVCLVWTRRLSVSFNEDGEITGRSKSTPGEANVPTMRLKGSRRSFHLQHPETGKTTLRLIDWPKQPISIQPVSSSINEQE